MPPPAPDIDEREIYQGRLRFRTTVAAAVYDADTIRTNTARLEFGYGIAWDVPVGVRLFNVDTPELRPKQAGRSPASLARERRAARLARDRLRELLEAAEAIRFISRSKSGFGKYARLLGTILIPDLAAGGAEGGAPQWIDVTDILVREGHATRYGGGTKQAFDDWYNGPA